MASGVELATAWIRLVPSMDGLTPAINKAVNGSDTTGALNRGGKSMGAVLTGAIAGAAAMATSKAVGMVTGAIDGAIKRVDTMNNFPKIMKNLGYSADDAEKSIKKMGDRLTGLPTSLNSMAGIVQQLAPLTGGLDKATELSLALNNAMLAGGKDTQLQANAMEQYTQMLALGKVDMAAWRSMVGAMPGQMDQLSISLLGAGNKSMDLYAAMKDGTVSFDEFNDAMLKLNSEGVDGFASFEQQARDSTEGIGTAQANLMTSMTRGMAKIIGKIAPQLVGALEGISAGAGWAFDAAASLIDLFLTGSFGEGLASSFGWAEDSPIVVFLIDVRNGVVEAGRVLGEFAGGVLAQMPGALAAVSDGFLNTITWMRENATLVKVLAGIIGTLMIPVFIQLGVKAIASGTKQVAAWTMSAAGAVKTKAVYVVESYKIIGTWITMGLAAIKSGAQTVAIWAMLKWDAIKAAAVYAAQSGRVAASWALQSAAAVLSGAKTVGSLVATKVALVAQKGVYIAQAAATGIATGAQKLFNLAMKANPIGLVITAVTALVGALVWFFTQTEVGREAWGNFTQFLTEAWTNIANFAADIWGGIAEFFVNFWKGLKWTFQNVVDWVVDLFMNWTVYGLIIKNWDEISAFFVQTWENIKGFFSAATTWVTSTASTWGTNISRWWTGLWNGVGSFFSNIWTGIKLAFSLATSWVINTARSWGAGFKTWWDGLWSGVGSFFAGTWDSVKAKFQTMMDWFRTKPVEAFQAARDAIGDAWRGIQELAAKPVRFVVNTVINGLIGTINNLPGVNIPKVSLPRGFARGGILPGMSRMSDGDDQMIMARRGEGMMVSEALRTSADRSAFLAANAAGRRGVGFASLLQGLAKGGLVHPMPGAAVTTTWMGYPGHTGIDLAKPQGTPIQSAGKGVVSKQFYHVNYGNMVDVDHGGGLSTRYAHMLGNVAVRLGEAVKTGQVLGYEGSTGNSTGPHLHYEVMHGGRPVDPAPYLTGGGVKPLFGVIEGLVDMATGQLAKAFPEGGMWIEAAGGVLKSGVKSVADWATDLLSVGGGGVVPKLFDSGGWLMPGLTLTNNQSGVPEPVFASHQWDAIKNASVPESTGRRDGDRWEMVLDDGTTLGGYIRRRAGELLKEKTAPVSAGALASVHGGRRR